MFNNFQKWVFPKILEFILVHFNLLGGKAKAVFQLVQYLYTIFKNQKIEDVKKTSESFYDEVPKSLGKYKQTLSKEEFVDIISTGIELVLAYKTILKPKLTKMIVLLELAQK